MSESGGWEDMVVDGWNGRGEETRKMKWAEGEAEADMHTGVKGGADQEGSTRCVSHSR